MDNNNDLMVSTSENSKKIKPSVDEEIIEHIDDSVVSPQVITLPSIVEQPMCETSILIKSFNNKCNKC